MGQGLGYLREINTFSDDWRSPLVDGLDNYERAVVCTYALCSVGVDAKLIEGTIRRKSGADLRITGLAIPSEGIEFVSTTGVLGPMEAARSMYRMKNPIPLDDIREISLPPGSVPVEDFMNVPQSSQVKEAALMTAAFLERLAMAGATPEPTSSTARLRL